MFEARWRCFFMSPMAVHQSTGTGSPGACERLKGSLAQRLLERSCTSQQLGARRRLMALMAAGWNLDGKWRVFMDVNGWLDVNYPVKKKTNGITIDLLNGDWMDPGLTTYDLWDDQALYKPSPHDSYRFCRQSQVKVSLWSLNWWWMNHIKSRCKWSFWQ